MLRASVFSLITHRYVVLVFASLFPLSFPFNYCCGCDSILGYVHVPHIYCLIISLNWYFVNWGSKRSRVFYTHFEHSHYVMQCPLLSN